MPLQIPNAVYCPDVDSGAIPGALVDMAGWAPLQNGFYGSVGITNNFDVTTDTAFTAMTFPKLDGTVRLLVFNKDSIQEYDSSGTATSRGTYSETTTGWDAAAWGDRIIAVNYVNDTQTSTGAAFSALSGSPPKARCVAANLNFVMLADVNDGGSNVYSDMVWWSALQNPESWAASIATQAGYIRLLDTPGAITQLVAFKDAFFAFKENSIYVGSYVGPPFIFEWRLISSKVGVSGKTNHAVVELDDKLYFPHTTGFYEFDGVTLRNVGLPVWATILNSVGFTATEGAGLNPGTISDIRLAVDDIEGVVWMMAYAQDTASSTYIPYAWAYNVRTNKWARFGRGCYNEADSDVYGTSHPIFVETSHSDMRTFFGANANAKGRVWRIDNFNGDVPYMHELRYPADWTDVSSLTTAMSGSQEGSVSATGVCYRIVYGSSAAPFDSATLYGYENETRLTGEQVKTLTLNSDIGRFDGTLNSKFRYATVSGLAYRTCILAGLGIELAPPSKR